MTDPVFEEITAADGLVLRTARWVPEGARASVLLLSGRTEYVEKYTEVIDELLTRDLAVFTFDWRGQGRSGRLLADTEKRHVGHYSDYLADLDLVHERIVAPHAPAPLYMLAHSMGGHIGLRHAGERPALYARIVLSAPMFDLPFTGLARFAVLALVRAGNLLGLKNAYAPGTGPYGDGDTRFADNRLTTDQARFERMVGQIRSDPILALGGPTYGWLRATFASIAALNAPAFARAIDTPILLASAGQEKIVDNPAHARMAAHMPHAQHIVLDAARHEILMEADAVRAEFFKQFDAFIGEDAG
jgi:lysophospholipase